MKFSKSFKDFCSFCAFGLAAGKAKSAKPTKGGKIDRCDRSECRVGRVKRAAILREGQGVVTQQAGGVAYGQVEAARNSGEGDGGAETPTPLDNCLDSLYNSRELQC